MTQKQLAELLSVTDKTVSKWETGYTVPDVEMLDKLAKVFGCTMDELVHGDRLGSTPSVDTEATLYADTVVLGGNGGKYFLSGFICALYGDATVENLTFSALGIDHPGRDYDDALSDKAHSRNTTALIGGIVDDPASGTAGRSVTNVTLRNITLDDTCSIKGMATAAGLVGYVGSCGDEDVVDHVTVTRRLFNGTLTIVGCHVSANIKGGPETATYGPCGGLVGYALRSKEGTSGKDADGMNGELYTIVIEDCTFDGSVTGYQGVGAAVGDMMAGVVIFRGKEDFASATLTSLDPEASNMMGVIGRVTATSDVVVYYSTATIAGGELSAIGCYGAIGSEAQTAFTDVDTRDAAAKFDTQTDDEGNPIGGNNGSIE